MCDSSKRRKRTSGDWKPSLLKNSCQSAGPQEFAGNGSRQFSIAFSGIIAGIPQAFLTGNHKKRYSVHSASARVGAVPAVRTVLVPLPALAQAWFLGTFLSSRLLRFSVFPRGSRRPLRKPVFSFPTTPTPSLRRVVTPRRRRLPGGLPRLADTRPASFPPPQRPVSIPIFAPARSRCSPTRRTGTWEIFSIGTPPLRSFRWDLLTQVFIPITRTRRPALDCRRRTRGGPTLASTRTVTRRISTPTPLPTCCFPEPITLPSIPTGTSIARSVHRKVQDGGTISGTTPPPT